jgi:hypothetical protein
VYRPDGIMGMVPFRPGSLDSESVSIKKEKMHVQIKRGSRIQAMFSAVVLTTKKNIQKISLEAFLVFAALFSVALLVYNLFN